MTNQALSVWVSWSSSLRKLSEDKLAWVLIGALAFADAVGLVWTGMGLTPGPCLYEVAAVAVLLAISWMYQNLRREPRLVVLATTGAQLLAYTSCAAVFSYLVTAGGRPEIDTWLVSADKALGLDWFAMHAWVSAHRWLNIVLVFAYFSLIPQFLLVQVILLTGRDYARGRELFWLFVTTSLGCVLVSGLFPAAGAFVTFNVSLNDPYVTQFLALRKGTLGTIDLEKMQGVIQFPSFHLAMAVILVYAARGRRLLFPFLLVLNALVIVATPPIGGHHFADLWGGALLTLAAIALVRRAQKA
jgi:hypothetical protein